MVQPCKVADRNSESRRKVQRKVQRQEINFNLKTQSEYKFILLLNISSFIGNRYLFLVKTFI